MKKALLFLSLGIYGLMNAQQAPVQPSGVFRAKMLLPTFNSVKTQPASTVSNAQSAVSNASKKIRNHSVSNAASVNKVLFASSYNMNSIVNANCTQVTANTDLGLVAFTHLECLSFPYGNGACETDYSTNNGYSWDTSKAIINKNWETRYPNGIILNPSGNTTATKAYAVSTCSVTNGTRWDSVAYGSIRLDGANGLESETVMYPNTTAGVLNVFSPSQFESVTDDSVVHSVMDAWTLNASGKATDAFYGAVVNKGVWSGTTHSVTWSQKVLKPHFASLNGLSAPADSDAEVSAVAMAWSQDGSVGYVVFFGNLDSAGYDFCSLQPVIYKSTDYGNAWNMMPLYNFANLADLTKHLVHCKDNASVKLPFWDINGDSAYYAGHGVDVTVDINNNLHIFGAIESGAINNPDSGGYAFNPASGSPRRYIYDVYTTTSTGGWQADLLDSLKARGVDPNTTYWKSVANGSITWGARIQASRTNDGSKVFCTWIDDDFGDAEMIYPDIFSIGIDVVADLKTAPTVFTNDGSNYFLCVSDIATPNGSCWDIPCVVVYDPYKPDAGITPVYFVYVQGIEHCSFTITDAPQVVNNDVALFSVTPNYPNPFSKSTCFDVSLSNESDVGVMVYNIVGEKVMTLPTQKLAGGKHTITFNGSGLSSGVYFYTVTANNSSITQKMIVQ